MGLHDTDIGVDPRSVRNISRAVIRDMAALEQMLEAGVIEEGCCRLGAEQELFLTDDRWDPAPIAEHVLADAADERFVSEVALFNLEANLEPIDVRGRTFSDLQIMLEETVALADAAARRHGGHALICGILPTLRPDALSIENLTPRDRYRALNAAVMRAAGGVIRLRLQGIDELLLDHDNVLLEGCNTSFQVHLQVDPDAFAAAYNVAQAIAGPLLAACVNSPLLFGRRLWRETRIALFHQSVDALDTATLAREVTGRVWFGESWAQDSVLDVFRENLARFRPLLTAEIAEDPFETLAAGGAPKLRALQLHNGNVYRWNRPCYGVYRGRAHLRIECRVLPAGPTVVDEVANAAFWIGLVLGGTRRFGHLPTRLAFEDARANLIAAARLGLDTGFTWLDGERLSATELIRDRLLPIARLGLLSAHVDESDIDYYLGIVDRRVVTGSTGAQWTLRSDQALRRKYGHVERMAILTAAMNSNARKGLPVHDWPTAEDRGEGRPHRAYERVEDCMTTDLFTLREDDAVDLVAFLMNHRGIRQILVEDDEQRLVGIISYRTLLQRVADGKLHEANEPLPVRDIMVRELITIEPGTPMREAVRIMREANVTALPVVRQGKLLGIISEHDLLPVVARLLDEKESDRDPRREG